MRLFNHPLHYKRIFSTGTSELDQLRVHYKELPHKVGTPTLRGGLRRGGSEPTHTRGKIWLGGLFSPTAIGAAERKALSPVV